MKTAHWLVCIILSALVSVAVCYISWFSNKSDDRCEEIAATEMTRVEQCGDEECRLHFKWCDQIYHQAASCPKHGQVFIPAKVRAKMVDNFSEWCRTINHENINCPGYGGIGE